MQDGIQKQKQKSEGGERLNQRKGNVGSRYAVLIEEEESFEGSEFVPSSLEPVRQFNGHYKKNSKRSKKDVGDLKLGLQASAVVSNKGPLKKVGGSNGSGIELTLRVAYSGDKAIKNSEASSHRSSGNDEVIVIPDPLIMKTNHLFSMNVPHIGQTLKDKPPDIFLDHDMCVVNDQTENDKDIRADSSKEEDIAMDNTISD
ncbi:hypothetical protein REPUB_Repub09cG0141100 [Reevesia pubescens]